MFVYTDKTVEGLYKSTQLNRRHGPCRIGVYFDVQGNIIRNCRIGFIDSQTAPIGSAFRLADLDPSARLSLDDAIIQLAKALSGNFTKGTSSQLRVEALTYNDKGVLNDFAQQTVATLRAQLHRLNPNIQVEGPSRSWAQSLMSVKGAYRRMGDDLEFTAQVYDPTGQPIGPLSSARLPISNLGSKNWLPDETTLATAVQVRDTLRTTDTALPKASRLQFDLTTRQGATNILYFAGDTMNVFVRANQPCFVRLVYRNADRSMTLLRNADFEITVDQINQWIAIPDDFVCYGPPFGAEFLLGYAANQPFAALDTEVEKLGVNAQGMEESVVHIKSDLASVKKQSSNRGMKTASGSVVERMVQITTRARLSD